MIKLLPALIILFSAALPRPASGLETSESGISLEDFRWKNRLVILTAPSTDDPSLKKQLELFRDEDEGLRERDLRIIRIHKGGQSFVDSSPLDPESARNILKAAGLDTGSFTFTLFGKDGTSKLSSPAPVSAEKLYSIIDRMPMRRREILERRNQPQ